MAVYTDLATKRYQRCPIIRQFIRDLNSEAADSATSSDITFSGLFDFACGLSHRLSELFSADLPSDYAASGELHYVIVYSNSVRSHLKDMSHITRASKYKAVRRVGFVAVINFMEVIRYVFIAIACFYGHSSAAQSLILLDLLTLFNVYRDPNALFALLLKPNLNTTAKK